MLMCLHHHIMTLLSILLPLKHHHQLHQQCHQCMIVEFRITVDANGYIVDVDPKLREAPIMPGTIYSLWAGLWSPLPDLSQLHLAARYNDEEDIPLRLATTRAANLSPTRQQQYRLQRLRDCIDNRLIDGNWRNHVSSTVHTWCQLVLMIG
jgi:hypothetical protein